MRDIEQNLSLSDQIRRRCIIEYVKKNPECEKEDVITYCTEIGEGSRVTLGESIKDLIKEGILNDGKLRKNSKSYKLTVAHQNLLLTLPNDLEELFLRFKSFVNAVKEWCISPETTFRTKYGDPPRKIDGQRITRLVTVIPYFTMDIVIQVYNAYFIVTLPEKVNRKDQIRKLNSIYFQYISQMYTLISEELNDYIPKQNLGLSNRSIHYHLLITIQDRPTIDKLCLLINDCHAFSLQKELFEILNFIWKKNIDIAYDQYGKYFEGFDATYTDKIEKSYLEIDDPKLGAIYRSISIFLHTENNLYNKPKSNYFYEEEEDSFLDKIFK